MTHPPSAGVTRRGTLLGLAAGFALGGARLALADAPAAGQARFVVVILRGALDGLAAVPAYGDAAFAAQRGELALAEPGRENGALDLGGFYGLHPKLAVLHGLYQANQALVLHAVAGPYRSRSHFEAQDFLESGAENRLSSGWLNRALQAMPNGAGARPGLAVGVDVPLLLRGPARVGSWAPPGARSPEPDLMLRLAALNARDPVLGPAMQEGLRARGFAANALQGVAPAQGDRNAFPVLAAAAGRLLAAPDGPRVAALELTGWDTHAYQPGRLNYPLQQLDNGLAALQQALGEAWRSSAVLVVTEFGRTVRINGTRGTDHGTGGVALLAGGAVAGGRVVADWPGLADGKLWQNRDLQPTTDLRAVAKSLLRDHLRLTPAAVAAAFPGSEGVTPLSGLVRH